MFRMIAIAATAAMCAGAALTPTSALACGVVVLPTDGTNKVVMPHCILPPSAEASNAAKKPVVMVAKKPAVNRTVVENPEGPAVDPDASVNASK
jgi:hypothetical protein